MVVAVIILLDELGEEEAANSTEAVEMELGDEEAEVE